MQHEVSFDLPTRDLGKSDVHFTIMGDGAMLGKLEVSKGTLVWYPSGTTYGHKINWSQFGEMMSNYPRLERRKKK